MAHGTEGFIIRERKRIQIINGPLSFVTHQLALFPVKEPVNILNGVPLTERVAQLRHAQLTFALYTEVDPSVADKLETIQRDMRSAANHNNIRSKDLYQSDYLSRYIGGESLYRDADYLRLKHFQGINDALLHFLGRKIWIRITAQPDGGIVQVKNVYFVPRLQNRG